MCRKTPSPFLITISYPRHYRVSFLHYYLLFLSLSPILITISFPCYRLLSLSLSPFPVTISCPCHHLLSLSLSPILITISFPCHCLSSPLTCFLSSPLTCLLSSSLTCLLSSALCSLILMSSSDSVRRLILGGDTGRRGLLLAAGFKITSKARLPDFSTGLLAAQQSTQRLYNLYSTGTT